MNLPRALTAALDNLDLADEMYILADLVMARATRVKVWFLVVLPLPHVQPSNKKNNNFIETTRKGNYNKEETH